MYADRSSSKVPFGRTRLGGSIDSLSTERTESTAKRGLQETSSEMYASVFFFSLSALSRRANFPAFPPAPTCFSFSGSEIGSFVASACSSPFPFNFLALSERGSRSSSSAAMLSPEFRLIHQHDLMKKIKKNKRKKKFENLATALVPGLQLQDR